jgi:hypothetical protein
MPKITGHATTRKGLKGKMLQFLFRVIIGAILGIGIYSIAGNEVTLNIISQVLFFSVICQAAILMMKRGRND